MPDAPSIDALDSADRGFLTLIATLARLPLEALWARIGAEVEGERLTTLDLSPLGGALRAAGPDRRLAPPFAGLDALQRLDVTGLGLDSVDVRWLPELRVLRCGDNRLRELDVSANTGLEELDCAGNQLMVLDVRALTALRVLRCASNGLGALVLPTGEATSLVEVDASRNQLMVLELGVQPALVTLKAFRNALVELSLTGAPELVTLDLARNELTALSLPELPALRELVVARNRLDALPLQAVPRLERLVAHGNLLPELPLAGLLGLRVVSAAHNQLREVGLGELPSLVALDVGSNRLGSLSLAGCGALAELRCPHNELTALDLSATPELALLDCTANRLPALQVGACERLVELRCGGNPLSALDLQANRRLWRLTAPEGVELEIRAAQAARLASGQRVDAAVRGDDLSNLGRFELHALAVALRATPHDERLLEIVMHPECDLGTALLVYWTRSPGYYQRFARREEVPAYAQQAWDLLRSIEARVASGAYGPAQVAFDPRDDRQTRSVRGVDWTEREGAGLPAFMQVAARPST